MSTYVQNYGDENEYFIFEAETGNEIKVKSLNSSLLTFESLTPGPFNINDRQ